MKALINLFFYLSVFFGFAQSHVYVNGYTRSNGTYVEGHYRTAPDNTINNNFSTVGNVNPYTGEKGTVPRSNETAYFNTPAPMHVPDLAFEYRPAKRLISDIPEQHKVNSAVKMNSKPIKSGGGKYFRNNSGKRNYVVQIIKQI